MNIVHFFTCSSLSISFRKRTDGNHQIHGYRILLDRKRKAVQNSTLNYGLFVNSKSPLRRRSEMYHSANQSYNLVFSAAECDENSLARPSGRCTHIVHHTSVRWVCSEHANYCHRLHQITPPRPPTDSNVRKLAAKTILLSPRFSGQRTIRRSRRLITSPFVTRDIINTYP